MNGAIITANRHRRQPYSYRQDAAVPAFPDTHPIIVFDGLCGFCSAWVRFVLRFDRHARFRLLAGQSALGQALYVHYGLNPDDFESNILIEDGVAAFKADACLRMAGGLGAPWSLSRFLRILPMRWLDAAYDLIARNRLRIWGKRDTCFLPEPRFKDRFLA
jgi:predicted DCC family thiol-disulfide oxidoreductase YuxK